MVESLVQGHVVVVAGDAPLLAGVVDDLVAAGALVGYVSSSPATGAAHATFRADPADDALWERVGPHVEQRLGPIDVVICSPAVHPLVESFFGADLRRRGHGELVVVDTGVDAAAVVSRLVGTR